MTEVVSKARQKLPKLAEPWCVAITRLTVSKFGHLVM
jgi:hypothetical protein